MPVSRKIIGDRTARICRSTYDSHEHSIIVTLATQIRQPTAGRAGSTEMPALGLNDIAFDATIGPVMDRENTSVGVIGLGIMGGAFARHLAVAGVRTLGYDPQQASIEGL